MCSIQTIVDAARRGSPRIVSTSSWHSPSVRPPAISSSSSSRGSVASARASSSRLRSSSVSDAGRLVGARQQMPVSLEDVGAAVARPRASRLPLPKAAATSRFSNTVRFSNGCGIWYERPMPARQRCCGGVARDVAAVEADCAGVGREVAGDQVEQRRSCRRRSGR